MGLAEKRVLQEFKDKNFINFQQQLQQKAKAHKA